MSFPSHFSDTFLKGGRKCGEDRDEGEEGEDRGGKDESSLLPMGLANEA
jgi:hypothetical protein